MTVHSRRALRVTATLAGVGALSASFSGTAFAIEHGGSEQDNSVRHHTDEYSDAYLGDLSGGRTQPGDLAVGPRSELGLMDFALPTAGPSLAPAKKKKKDDGRDDADVSNASGSAPRHYYPGSAENPYDYDLYNPMETYGANRCKDKGADRAPAYSTTSLLPGYNGSSADDCKYDSGDYKGNTGYVGKDKSNGHSGYVGTDRSRQ